ncbi:MAG TPA: cytochrome c4 [Burkholderiales bacterium]|nr:cytochrome c4 [Burkholderiales bacterium]
MKKLLLLSLLAAIASHADAAESRKVENTIAQRAAACTTCHGKEGRATNQGYFPRIAGKPAGYLYNQLVNFREGRRTYALMTYLVDHLTDEYLLEIAQYFASLDLPYPPPQRPSASPAALQRAERLVQEGDQTRKIPACTQCHGDALTGVAPAIPGLLGLSSDYLQAQLGHWKSGERRAQQPDCMAKIAAQLTPDEVGALSSWLAAQAVPRDAKPAGAMKRPAPMDCGGVPK